MTIADMKTAIHTAARDGQKTAMFHLLILTNARDLEGLNAKEVCGELGVPLSYATEFTKMIGLAQLMKERGLRIL